MVKPANPVFGLVDAMIAGAEKRLDAAGVPHIVSAAAPKNRQPCRCERLAFPHRRDRKCDDLEDRMYEAPATGLQREPSDRELFDAREARGINGDMS